MTDIHIPPAALEAGARALAAVRMPNYTWDDLDREMQAYLLNDARAAFLAMIEAWPGMRERPFWDFMTGARHIEIILPIPKGLDFIDPLTAQENPDDKA